MATSYTLTAEAKRRILAATKKVERTPIDRNGGRTPTQHSGEGFWAMLMGSDISGVKYSYNKVVFDSTSAHTEVAFTLNDTHTFAFDGEPVFYSAIEVNGNRGIEPGTVVWLRFAGYNGGDGDPVYLFQFEQFDVNAPIYPHDHRDNNNGGFAFGTYHPGTSIPQMPWGA